MNVPAKSETDLPKIIQAIADLAVGNSNAVRVGTVELDSTAEFTVVNDALCSERSMPVLVPVNAAAARSGWYVRTVRKSLFEIGHSANIPGALFRYELRRN
ncbi:hypothetical protein [Methylobacterium sp. Leaf85]|uniref:hypothetical protein n=1 Tax=Methylobacterium sp. Leaf85 TaxID=1736241 RepID=UPI0006FA13C2|nr:hypothetical protein [Methylobacterium sp. Leaf85]KQO43029.1 hypothetical protein ASF08_10655 [Methylobacterium sp. Leaf85]